MFEKHQSWDRTQHTWQTKHVGESLVSRLADSPLFWLIFGVINHWYLDSSLAVPCLHRGAH